MSVKSSLLNRSLNNNVTKPLNTIKPDGTAYGRLMCVFGGVFVRLYENLGRLWPSLEVSLHVFFVEASLNHPLH